MTIQVTEDDIVLLGHGSYEGGATNFTLPDGVELYILQPVGYTLTTDVAEALIDHHRIDRLTLHHDKHKDGDDGRGVSNWEPASPLAAGLAPNLKLYPLGEEATWGRNTIGTHRNVVTVSQTTNLSDLLDKNASVVAAIKAARTKGKRLRVFWSACASQKGISDNTASLS